tara:strand:+ start:1002 stop:1361 length:360 start_codon:yes stop_codon:yes gene_type:complete
MAIALAATGFQDAVDYKVIQCTGIDATTAQVNATNSSGSLLSVIIDSANSSDNVSLHIIDTADTTDTQIAFKGKASSIKTFVMPQGYDFTELKFYVSKLSTATDNTSFAGSVDVTLVCS